MGEGVLEIQNSKCQDLTKFQFGGGEAGFEKSKLKVPRSDLISIGGGVLDEIPEQVVLADLSTNSALPLSGSPCITDSLSHTTYVETNQ